MSFETDIQGQNTQLYPIVEIDGIWYSTNNVTVGDNYCKPILMNIPSIKESIDVESRKFKISNVSLQFNNFPFDGVRFSDQLSETSLINTEATIYFKSQSTTTIDTDVDTDLHEAYKGIIRRISHDDTSVKIELEDLTEQKAHKDLPQAYLGDGDNIPAKYKNKPIPFVYGVVDASPSVYTFSSEYVEGEGTDYNLIFGDNLSFPTRDVEEGIDIFGNNTGLKVIDNGKYLNVTGTGNNVGKYTSEDTVEIDGNTYNSIRLYKKFGDEVFQRNPFSVGAIYVEDNIPLMDGVAVAGTQEYTTVSETTDVTQNFNLIGMIILPIQIISNIFSGIGGAGASGGVYLDDGTDVYPEPNSGNLSNSPQTFLFNDLDVFKSQSSYTFVDGFNVSHTSAGAVRKFSILWSLQDVSQNAREVDDLAQTMKYSFFIKCDSISTGNVSGTEAITSTSSTIAYKLDLRFRDDGTDVFSENLFLSNSDETFSGNKFIGGTNNPPQHLSLNLFGFPELDGFTNNENFGANCDLAVNNLKVRVLYALDALKNNELSRDFYANVNGRINTFDDHPEFDEEVFIENPIDIIYDLVRSEIEHHDIDDVEYAEAKAAHADWKFGFTVNKKINSKKLIQEIAKSTKCFPKFKNDGTFGFNTIKDSYTVSAIVDGVETGDYNTATEIKESEVISYSFKKTKPEQIYKNVTVSYNKDYAQDSYLKTTEEGAYDLGADPYYGIELSADAHLEFESDYIRHDSATGAEQTADKLASFLSEQYKNDHLLFNLKLPLQYISLEIGDLVKFEDLFQGVKAYGIDYRMIGGLGAKADDDSYSQYAYPLFMVTATTKNLDSVSIECMQLHHLSTDEIDSAWFDGTDVGDTEGEFYFPDSDPIVIIDQYSWVIPADTWSANNIEPSIEFDYSWDGLVGTYIFDWTVDAGLADLFSTPNEQGLTRMIRIEGNTDEGYYSGTYEIIGGVTNTISNNTPDNSLNLRFIDSYMNNIQVADDRLSNIFNQSLTITEVSLESTINLGDVNLDNQVNILDIVGLVNYILGTGTIEAEYNADFNQDGQVNILDIVQITNHILDS